MERETRARLMLALMKKFLTVISLDDRRPSAHESGPAAPGTGNWCNWTDRDHGGARVIITELKQMKNTKTHLDRIITPADFSLYISAHDNL